MDLVAHCSRIGLRPTIITHGQNIHDGWRLGRKTCRGRRIWRTLFYEYKHCFQSHGVQDLQDLPPVHHSHPWTTLPETVERILACAEKIIYACEQ